MPRERDKPVSFKKPFRAVPLRRVKNSPKPRFDRSWNRTRNIRRLWSRWSWLLFLALLAAAWFATERLGWFDGEWEPVTVTSAGEGFTICGRGSSANCVVDGDTIRLGSRRIRLIGYDTPELDGDCDHERMLARMARDDLVAWLNYGDFELTASADAPRDQYGRELLEARRAGEALADTMIARGLARRDRYDRDWCS